MEPRQPFSSHGIDCMDQIDFVHGDEIKMSAKYPIT